MCERNIAAIKALNALGYGRRGRGLTLDLVHSPQGPSLRPPSRIEADYKEIWKVRHRLQPALHARPHAIQRSARPS
jgi:hypothetical protein